MSIAIRPVLIAMALGALHAGAFAAGAGAGAGQRPVRYNDLDLSRRPGVTVLYSRILFAAREVCEPVNAGSLQAIARKKACVEQALARAVRDVNSPALSGYYLFKTGRPTAMAQARQE